MEKKKEENNKIIMRVTPTPETSMLVMNYKSCTSECEAKCKKKKTRHDHRYESEKPPNKPRKLNKN